MMGYKTVNEDKHDCVYCGLEVEEGQGVLLKYSKAQSDEEIKVLHLSDKVSHIPCVVNFGTVRDQEALV